MLGLFDVVAPVDGAHVIDGTDMSMMQSRRSARFPQKARPFFQRLLSGKAWRLQCDISIKLGVAGPIDYSERALTQNGTDLKTSKFLPRHSRHGLR